VKEQIRAEFLADLRRERIHLDMGWSDARIAADFDGFVAAVHDHLHELALTVQPMGLHTFGRGVDEKWRIAQVLTMLGKDFWEGVKDPNDAKEEADELMVADYTKLVETKPYRLLAAHLKDGAEVPHLDAAAREKLAQARRWYEDLGAANELRALLGALDGRYTPTSYGGDPIKNPDALPTGRNLYGFDPSRVPTKAAWEAGKQALDQLLAGTSREVRPAAEEAHLHTLVGGDHAPLRPAGGAGSLGAGGAAAVGRRRAGLGREADPARAARPAPGGRGAVGHRAVPRPLSQRDEAARRGGAPGQRSPRRGRQPGGRQLGAHRTQPRRQRRAGGRGPQRQAPPASSPANRAATAPGWTTPHWPPTPGRPKAKATASWPSSTSRACSTPTARTRPPGAAPASPPPPGSTSTPSTCAAPRRRCSRAAATSTAC
jgi:hypothetical protein